MKVYKITTETKNHLGQPLRYYGIVSEEQVKMYCENKKIEGYTIVEIKEQEEEK